MVFNTGPYTALPDNSILITANMQSETGVPSSHQLLKSYVVRRLYARLKLAARAVQSADAGLLVFIISTMSSIILAVFLPRRGCSVYYRGEI